MEISITLNVLFEIKLKKKVFISVAIWICIFPIESSEMWVINLKGICLWIEIMASASSSLKWQKIKASLAAVMWRAVRGADARCALCRWMDPSTPQLLPGQAEAQSPSRAFHSNASLERGYQERNRFGVFWHPAAAYMVKLDWAWVTILGDFSQTGHTVTFSFPHYVISHLPSLCLLLFLQAKHILWKIPFSIDCVQVLGKKYFHLQKRELGNSSRNSNCNTIATTNC